MTTITVINPWSGATLHLDITGLTQAALDSYAERMDDDVREALHDALAPCTPEDYLAAYVERVGAVAAGVLLLGG